MDTLIRKAYANLKTFANMENVVLAIAAFIALSLLWNTMGTLQNNFQLQQQVDVLKQEAELLELETQNLEFQQGYAKSNEFLELSARERLGKVLPGEKVIILPPTNEAEYAEQAETVRPRQTRTNFEQWLYFFFGPKSS